MNEHGPFSYGIFTDPQQAEAIKNMFTEDGFNQLMDGLGQQAADIANDPERAQHFTAQTTVSVASMIVPGMQITKIGKLGDALNAGTDGLKTVTNKKVFRVY